jgi:hypothetical protein
MTEPLDPLPDPDTVLKPGPKCDAELKSPIMCMLCIAGTLPAEALDLCEVEPLRREEPGSARWVPDELLPSAYVQLEDLKVGAQTTG